MFESTILLTFLQVGHTKDPHPNVVKLSQAIANKDGETDDFFIYSSKQDVHLQVKNEYFDRFQLPHWAKAVELVANCCGQWFKGLMEVFNNKKTLVCIPTHSNTC